MSQLWVVSDQHHRHRRTLDADHCGRPFSTVEDMDEHILARFNERVGPQDVVYMLGDFVFGEGKQQAAHALLSRMNGREIHWILGNHDNPKAAESLRQAGLVSTVTPYPGATFIRWKRQAITMSHHAHRTWPEQGRGGWSLYGHSHGSLRDDPDSYSLDVGVDTQLFGHERFTPYSFDELHAIFTTYKRNVPVDHHTKEVDVR